MSDLKYRMYGFVPYNISEIQKGIQFGHAVVEYQLLHGNTPQYKKWADHHKTFIILNGGTTNNSNDPNFRGTLNKKLDELILLSKEADHLPLFNSASFYEPDLGNQLTAFCFLLDERIYDFKKYPDYHEYLKLNYATLGYVNYYSMWLETLSKDKDEAEYIAKLKTYIKNAKLA